MKEYEIQQPSYAPNLTVSKGEKRSSKDWYTLFCGMLEGGDFANNTDKWCNQFPDWFRPVQTTLDEIYEKDFIPSGKTIVGQLKYVTDDEMATTVKKCMIEYHSTELKRELEEIIDNIKGARFHPPKSDIQQGRNEGIEEAISIIKKYVK